LLWRILLVDETHYYEGFYSVFDQDSKIHYERYPRSLGLIETLSDSWPVQRLQWFTKGFYAANANGGNVIITDLRMGSEPDYVFRFKVGEMHNPHPKAVPVARQPGNRNFGRLSWVWARIWDPQAQMP
jgi:inner membrane protein